MPKGNERIVAYVAFAAFCLLSAVRDVLSEFFFKDRLYEASPVFLLFVYSIVAQLIAVGFFFTESTLTALRKIPFRTIRKELFWLNAFTLAAWFFYYLAIDTPLGASLTSFVEYGSGPIFLAIVGSLVANDHIHKTFYWSAGASVIGIAVLAAPRLHVDNVSWPWIFGLALAVLTALSSAFYRVYFKILLDIGLGKSAIVFLRLIGMTVLLGIILCFQPKLFRAELLLPIAITGALGFAVPLFLMLIVLRRVPIPNYAMLLFCVPAATYSVSAVFGYGKFYFSDLLAAGLVLLGIAIHETSTRPDN